MKLIRMNVILRKYFFCENGKYLFIFGRKFVKFVKVLVWNELFYLVFF